MKIVWEKKLSACLDEIVVLAAALLPVSLDAGLWIFEGIMPFVNKTLCALRFKSNLELWHLNLFLVCKLVLNHI